MNPWCALAGSLICVAALGTGCSSDSSNGPAGQSGQAGTSNQSGGSSQSGASNHAGNAATAGSAGTATGGKPGAGGAGTAGSASMGGTTAAGAGSSAGAGGSAGEAPSGPYRAKLGEVCPVEAVMGVVELQNSTPLSVQVSLYDYPDPWITAADLTNPSCEFHRYKPGTCSACDRGLVCSIGGPCLPERRTIKNASLQVRTGSEQRQYSADPTLGGIYSELDIGDASSSFAMTLSWDDTEITLEAMPVASGELEDLAVETESNVDNMPGALDATWQAPGDGSFVRSRIPINHHAGGLTFTECRAPTSAGAFHADAEMIDPLSVQTGLEFQGIDHVFVAAAQTPRGCVEFRFGKRIGIFPIPRL